MSENKGFCISVSRSPGSDKVFCSMSGSLDDLRFGFCHLMQVLVTKNVVSSVVLFHMVLLLLRYIDD